MNILCCVRFKLMPTHEGVGITSYESSSATATRKRGGLYYTVKKKVKPSCDLPRVAPSTAKHSYD